METKFTPGPWKQIERAKGSVESINGRGIATCMGYTDTGNYEKCYAENIANAKLIAVAPELADALEGILFHCGESGFNSHGFKDIDSAIENAKDVLKKATE